MHGLRGDMGIMESIKGFFGGGAKVEASSRWSGDYSYGGEKYPGGLSPVIDILRLDYWELRRRSERLFYSNGYARGLIRRYVTAVINTGLSLESVPEESIIGVAEDSLSDWSEFVENSYHLWSHTPEVCDVKGRRTMGQIERQIFTEALVGGDCLVVIRQHARKKLPMVQVISGSRVCTPLEEVMNYSIVDGVELGDNGEHVAFHVAQNDGSSVRIPARGTRTGRVQAWMVYGKDKREDAVRGEPLLSIAIQNLAEIDKYRDSAQRKAFLNSAMVAAVERESIGGKMSMPVSSGAVRKGSVTSKEEGGRTVKTLDVLPGIIFEGMPAGETLKFFQNTGVDINFQAFENAIMVGVSWSLEMPPEIAMLSFNKNYSASQAALSEWSSVIHRDVVAFGASNNDNIFQDWFLSMVLLDKINAPGFLKAFDDDLRWDVARAWMLTDWAGITKKTTDLLKMANAYKVMVENGFTTNSRACRELTGQKYSKVIKQLGKENEMKSAAIRKLGDLQEVYGTYVRAGAITPQVEDEESIRDMISLPGVSNEVRDAWKKQGGARTPITLAKQETEEVIEDE